MTFRQPDERLPMIEWAPWWDKTIDRWRGEGLDPDLGGQELARFFQLDRMICLYGGACSPALPEPEEYGRGIVTDEASYDRIRPLLFTDEGIQALVRQAGEWKERHDAGEIIIRLWLDGFFWLPRVLFGIEGHLYAFSDYPELMKRINDDLAIYNIRVVTELAKVMVPDMIGYAEDMSYNHGPMISKALFDDFLAPYYRRVNPVIHELGIPILIDSDGEVTPMIPWLLGCGIDGVYPLERQAGVDVARIREAYPGFLMMGGFDKMTMSRGETAMRREFERLLPVMQSGGYIPSVDHQTPPEVSLEAYRTYLALFVEYAAAAVRNLEGGRT
jgi:hypothetical protein